MAIISSLSDVRLDTLAYFVAFLVVVSVVRKKLAPKPSAYLLNPRRWYEFTDARAVSEVLHTTRQTLEEWFHKHPTTPVRLTTDFGEMTFLPPTLADEIKSDKRLSFIKAANDSAFHTEIPGFEPFREGGRNEAGLIKEVIHGQLKKTLNKMTFPLAQETQLAVEHYLGANKEWHKIRLRDALLPLVTRISTRIFLGEDLCQNDKWISITSEYAANSLEVANRLRVWPKYMRYVVSYFSPGCGILRNQVKNARELITPIVERRRSEEKGKEYNDSLGWFEKTAKQAYNPAATQLFLSAVSVHTTTDLICQCLEDIAAHPEIIKPLQEEIRRVIAEEGWNTKAMYKMFLLDSVFKETQRLKPIQIASMVREAQSDITLSDGTFIPKGHQIAVSCHNMRDGRIYENPEKWDGYRFFRERQQSAREDKVQLSSTSVEHMGFGYGEHACPGRFFAAKQVKIVMMYLLLNYEWKIPEGPEPQLMAWCTTWVTDPDYEVLMRRKDKDDPCLRLELVQDD
uniref:Cytochrome P450 monooxygenase n=1 Tax=Fusarium lunulosporum TaxID=56643 RepID=A0A1B2TT85_FUSLU|nr:cytochrome P450 monooxygenase [Fusarium lunulosporum]